MAPLTSSSNADYDLSTAGKPSAISGQPVPDSSTKVREQSQETPEPEVQRDRTAPLVPRAGQAYRLVPAKDRG